jgi:hypothetical protein
MERAEVVRQRAQLGAIDDVAAEQNIARWLRVGEEGAFIGGELTTLCSLSPSGERETDRV